MINKHTHLNDGEKVTILPLDKLQEKEQSTGLHTAALTVSSRNSRSN